MSENSSYVAVIIVGFGNSSDIRDCLTALALSPLSPSFDIFICENGSEEDFEKLNNALVTADGPCNICPNRQGPSLYCSSDRFAEVECLALKGRSTAVWIARATHNLGYAGAINAWMTQLHNVSDWDGLWILNPDTKPYPNALAALVQRAATSNKGMISSTIVTDRHRELVHCRGLRWDRFLARAVSIGFHELAHGRCDVDAIEAAMDSPSGASMYVTRECAECVGPMDERFFLYFEDLDWGIRAKRFGLGYAKGLHCAP